MKINNQEYKMSHYHKKAIIKSILTGSIITATTMLVTRGNIPLNIYAIIAIEFTFTPYLCIIARADERGYKLFDRWFKGMDNLRNISIEYELEEDLIKLLGDKEESYINNLIYSAIKNIY